MDSYTLWENDNFIIITPTNPHQPYAEGLHIIIAPKRLVSSAWQDIDLAEATFKLTAQVCKVVEEQNLAPWQNIQANGNWGLLPGSEPSFHVHILGRNKTESWGKPIVLPIAPGTYQNDAMPEAHRKLLIKILSEMFSQ